MDNEVSSRREEEEEAEVVAEPISQPQENASGISGVQSTRRATKPGQTPYQKRMCDIEHARLVLMNEAYNKLRLLLDLPAKMPKVKVVQNAISYIKTKTNALQNYSGETQVSGISSVTDPSLHVYEPGELTSFPTEALSQAMQATPMELDDVPNSNYIESSCLPAFSDLPTNQQTFLTSGSLNPLTETDFQAHANVHRKEATEYPAIEIESQYWDNLASTDGASQEQTSAASAGPVGGTETDEATDDPFWGFGKCNVDGSPLFPYKPYHMPASTCGDVGIQHGTMSLSSLKLLPPGSSPPAPLLQVNDEKRSPRPTDFTRISRAETGEESERLVENVVQSFTNSLTAESMLPTFQQTFLTSGSLNPLTETDLQSHAISYMEIGTVKESQNWENLARTDGASQEQTSAASVRPVGGTETDEATDDPFWGFGKCNIDGSPLFPYKPYRIPASTCGDVGIQHGTMSLSSLKLLPPGSSPPAPLLQVNDEKRSPRPTDFTRISRAETSEESERLVENMVQSFTNSLTTESMLPINQQTFLTSGSRHPLTETDLQSHTISYMEIGTVKESQNWENLARTDGASQEQTSAASVRPVGGTETDEATDDPFWGFGKCNIDGSPLFPYKPYRIPASTCGDVSIQHGTMSLSSLKLLPPGSSPPAPLLQVNDEKRSPRPTDFTRISRAETGEESERLVENVVQSFTNSLTAESMLPTFQQTFLTSGSLNPLTETDLQSHTISYMEIGTVKESQNWENLARTDGASQEQTSAASVRPVGGTETDEATDDPFWGFGKCNIDGSPLFPYKPYRIPASTCGDVGIQHGTMSLSSLKLLPPGSSPPAPLLQVNDEKRSPRPTDFTRISRAETGEESERLVENVVQSFTNSLTAESMLPTFQQTFLTSGSLNPLTETDLQSHTISYMEIGTVKESQNWENLARTDGASQEQTSADSENAVGSHEIDWTSDEPYQHNVYALFSEHLSPSSLDCFAKKVMKSVSED